MRSLVNEWIKSLATYFLKVRISKIIKMKCENRKKHIKSESKYVNEDWAGMRWNHLEQGGTTWNKLKPSGTSWNLLEPCGTRWIQQQTDTQKKKIIHRLKRLSVQYHHPVEYNISNSYCHKGHHLRCLQVELPGKDWNQ